MPETWDETIRRGESSIKIAKRTNAELRCKRVAGSAKGERDIFDARTRLVNWPFAGISNERHNMPGVTSFPTSLIWFSSRFNFRCAETKRNSTGDERMKVQKCHYAVAVIDRESKRVKYAISWRSVAMNKMRTFQTLNARRRRRQFEQIKF